MHHNQQPAQTNNAIAIVMVQDIRIGDDPSVRCQGFPKCEGDGSIVMVRVDKCNNQQQRPGDAELGDDLALNIPKLFSGFSA